MATTKRPGPKRSLIIAGLLLVGLVVGYFLLEPSQRWYVAGFYFLAINLLAFFAMGWDKRRAVKDQRRVRERTLLLYGAIGGMWGMLFGMRTFRHKTQDRKFQLGVLGVILFNLLAYGLVLYYVIL